MLLKYRLIRNKRTSARLSRIMAIVLSITFIIGLSASELNAQKSGIGVGIMLGEPTGLSIKLHSSLALGVAWSFLDEAAIHTHLDYLRHHKIFSGDLRDTLPLHYGIGGRVKFRDDLTAGVRIPVGLTYEPASLPIDLFLEVVPMLNVIPNTDFGLNSAIGVRYYF